MKKAVAINAVGKYTTIILQLVVNAVLARIISPDDFGVVAIITVFSTFFMMLSDMGVSAAIVQRKDLTDSEVNSLFSCTIVIGIILAFLFCALGHGIAFFYQDSVFIPLGYLLSISLVFNTINMVPNGVMNRDKMFGSIAIRTVVSYAIAALIAIFLAYKGLRYYAVVIQTIISAVIVFIWNCVAVRPKIYFFGWKGSIKKIARYSGFQFAFNIVNYFSRNLDNLLTGKYLGKAELGYYNKSYQLMLYPVNNLAGVLTPAIHPLLSDFQDVPSKIYEKYIKIERILFIVAGFVAPFCFLASKEIILIMYGNQWTKSITCFTYLSLAILPQFVGSPIGAIYQSLGQTKLLFINSVINTSLTIAGIVVGITIGRNIEVLSICVATTYILHFFINNIILFKRGFNTKISTLFRPLLPDILIALITYMTVIIYPFNIKNVVGSVLIKALYLGVEYLLMLTLFGEYKFIVSILKKRK